MLAYHYDLELILRYIPVHHISTEVEQPTAVALVFRPT
jgi:hypothetical protein